MADLPRIDIQEPLLDGQLSAADTARLSRVAERNLAVSMSLRATAWALMAAGLRAFRPEMSADAVQDEVRARFLRASG